MMDWLPASIAAAAVALLVSPLLVSLAGSLLLRAAGKWPGISGWSPLATLFLVGFTPLLVGLAVGVGAFWPGVLGHVMHLCHCGPGPLHFGHSSVLHPELSATLLPYSASLMLLLLVNPIRIVLRSSSAQRAIRRRLVSNEHPQARCSQGDIRLVDMGQANAFAAGFFRPQICVDGAWWMSLTDQERKIVAAHERSHQRHRDALVLLVGRALWSVVPSGIPARLGSLLLLQMESRADRRAGRAAADPLSVAEFLLRLHRPSVSPPTAMAFIGTSVKSRVEALIAYADGARRIAHWQWFSLVVAATIVASAFVFRGVIHRTAEFLLSTF